MNAFWLIFKSYFKRDFDSIVSSILAPIFLLAGLIAAVAMAPGGEAAAETFRVLLVTLMIAAGYASFVIAYGLRHVLENGSGRLYPRFLQRHLQVSCVALIPFLLLPGVVLAVTGRPVLSSLAMLLLVSGFLQPHCQRVDRRGIDAPAGRLCPADRRRHVAAGRAELSGAESVARTSLQEPPAARGKTWSRHPRNHLGEHVHILDERFLPTFHGIGLHPRRVWTNAALRQVCVGFRRPCGRADPNSFIPE